jgi:hypothetical protein
VLRLMMLALGKGVVDGLTGDCTFAPKKEDAGLVGDEGAVDAGGKNGGLDDGAREEIGVNPGLKTGADEHAAPVTVTVASIKTVSRPSDPVEVKTEMPFGAPVDAGEGGEVGMAPKLKLDRGDVVGVLRGFDGTVLEGTIPPKLNTLVGDVEPN